MMTIKLIQVYPFFAYFNFLLKNFFLFFNLLFFDHITTAIISTPMGLLGPYLLQGMFGNVQVFIGTHWWGQGMLLSFRNWTRDPN